MTLTFDGGLASQMTAYRLLKKHKMRATFFVSSGLIGRPDRLTLPQLRDIAAAGNEIGGNTLSYVRLPTVDLAEKKRQVCNDRHTLAESGFAVRSFAYPNGAFDAHAAEIMKSCGYTAARAEGGLDGTRCRQNCIFSEALPPVDKTAIRTIPPVTKSTTLADIERIVTTAAKSGRTWVPFVFHEICDACSPSAITQKNFERLLTWLGTQAKRGVVVRTVSEATGDAATPVAATTTAPQRPESTLPNPSLEISADAGTQRHSVGADCWQRSSYGSNQAIWERVPDAHSGEWAERVSISSHSSGDQKLVTRQDDGGCAPATQEGREYLLSTWYKSTTPTRLVTYYRERSGQWAFWTQSPPFDATDVWKQASYRTPAVPDGATALSFGLALGATGTLTVDDFGISPVESRKFPLLWTAIGVSVAVFFPTVVFLVWIRLRRRQVRLA